MRRAFVGWHQHGRTMRAHTSHESAPRAPRRSPHLLVERLEVLMAPALIYGVNHLYDADTQGYVDGIVRVDPTAGVETTVWQDPQGTYSIDGFTVEHVGLILFSAQVMEPSNLVLNGLFT